MDLKLLEKNLTNHGFIVKFFETPEEASDYLCSSIKNETVGIGGSLTIKQMGIHERLAENNTVYWHWEKGEINKAATANIYMSSVNGLSMNGEIINIDGTANRISSIFYGHKKVYLILGINKIAEDYESALYRARNIAAVNNAKRLNMDTPCVKLGKCVDCQSKDRICCGLSVLWHKPYGDSEYEVVIINKELGF